MSKKNILFIVLISSFCSFLNAQSKDSLRTITIDEIVIISTPKEHTTLRDQPIASTQLSKSNIQALQIRNLKDISAIAPNIFIPNYGSKLTSAIYIRGIGSRINTPSVGLYVDNVPFLNQSSFDFNYADIERIDILRGPQSTLYGRNTMGGLIKVHTKSPFSYQGTDFQVGAATYNNYNASIKHYHRTSEKFAFSTGVFYEHEGGFFKNKGKNDQRIDKLDGLGGRFRGIYIPTDNLKFDLSMGYEYSDQGGYPYGEYNKETGEYFEPAYKAYRDNFKKFYDTGVTVLAGTDMVVYGSPLLPLPRELQYMVEYGITPLQAIQTATSNPAKVLGFENQRGLIKEGLDADLLVVSGDASKDITCLNDVKFVTLGGKRVFENGVRYVGTSNTVM